MAFQEQFFSFFREVPAKNAVVTGVPALFRLSFRRDNYTGAATELFLEKDPPISISVSESDGPLGVFSPINARRLSCTINVTELIDDTQFFVSSDRELMAILEIDDTGAGNAFSLHYAGWVLPAALRQKYAKKPYSLSVSASCGLSTIKDRMLIGPDGKRLSGLVSLSHVLRTALTQIGLDLQVVIQDNLYSTGVMGGQPLTNVEYFAPKCPMFDTKIRSDAFEKENGEVETAYEAISRILTAKGARICQQNGQWWIVRSDELPGQNWNISAPGTIAAGDYIRTYTGLDAALPPLVSAISPSFNQLVFPDQRARAGIGGTVSLSPVKNVIQLEQKFGSYVNILPNGTFSKKNASGFPTGWFSRNFPVAPAALAPYVTGDGTETLPYGLVVFGGGDDKYNEGTPWVGAFIQYGEGSAERAGQVKWKLTGRFKLQNLRAAKIIIVADAAGTNWVLIDGEWKKSPSRKKSKGTLIYHSSSAGGGAVKSKTGYAKIDIDIPPLTGIKILGVQLSHGELLDAPSAAQSYTQFENLSLSSVSESVKIDGVRVRIGNQKVKVETVRTITIGETPAVALPTERVNTIYDPLKVPFNVNLPARDHYRTFLDALALPGGTLLNLLAESYARQVLGATKIFEDKVYGRLQYGLFTCLRFPDIGQSVPGNTQIQPDAFLLTNWEYFPRECEHKVTAVQIRYLPDAKINAMPRKGEWQTPDGPIPMGIDETGVPENPSLPVRTTIEGRLTDIINRRFPPSLDATNKPFGFEFVEKNEIRLLGTAKKGELVISRQLSLFRKLMNLKLPTP